MIKHILPIFVDQIDIVYLLNNVTCLYHRIEYTILPYSILFGSLKPKLKVKWSTLTIQVPYYKLLVLYSKLVNCNKQSARDFTIQAQWEYGQRQGASSLSGTIF